MLISWRNLFRSVVHPPTPKRTYQLNPHRLLLLLQLESRIFPLLPLQIMDFLLLVYLPMTLIYQLLHTLFLEFLPINILPRIASHRRRNYSIPVVPAVLSFARVTDTPLRIYIYHVTCPQELLAFPKNFLIQYLDHKGEISHCWHIHGLCNYPETSNSVSNH
jgi:hypothetical protein